MTKLLLFLICFSLGLGLTTSAQTDLLVHYKLDETTDTIAADSSGNGYDAIVKGIANWVPGEIGGALELDGNSHVVLPAGDLGLTSDSGSVAFWINTDVPSSLYMLFWAGDNTTGGGFGPENEMHLFLESAYSDIWRGGELSFFVTADPNTFIFSDPDKFASGGGAGASSVNPILMSDLQWHHISVSWGEGSAKLYIDGDFIIGDSYTSTSYALSNILVGQAANGGRSYTGKLDDVRIYSRVLNAQEVTSLSNRGEPAIICTDTIINDTIVHLVSNIEFEASSPKIYLESIDSLKTSIGNCDSILLHYSKYTFLSELYIDTTWINDTTYVTVYDSVSVTDTLIIDVTINNTIQDEYLNTLKIYPNPAKEAIYIHTGNSFEQISDYRIKIINTLGTVIFESTLTQQIFEVDVRDFGQTGFFIVQIVNESNQIIDIRKILLE